MKQIFIAIFLVFSISSFGQKLEWIHFNWVGDSISGKYFDKLAITIPVSLDNLPHKFNMQIDLGAIETVIYGNSIKPYLDTYSELNTKIDTTLKFRIQSQTNFKFRDIEFKLGSVNFGKRNIGHFKNFGDPILIDSIYTKTEKHIGTIAPDLFKDKILIIDYPNKRLCVTTELPKQFSKAQFRNYKIKNGRIKIPITINGKDEDLMFDTGSSLFALMTTTEQANEISTKPIIDSLKISSWGEYYMVYGQTVTKPILFGKKKLNKSTVYFDNRKDNANFFKEEEIWGITGNAYFLKNIVIIDYKNQRFGVK
ncbi:MAG: hypothetical protein LCH67_03160 [Bacteroidetes bacterium]|nr:hypothetical protein [Bacteroidota bacterium]